MRSVLLVALSCWSARLVLVSSFRQIPVVVVAPFRPTAARRSNPRLFAVETSSPSSSSSSSLSQPRQQPQQQQQPPERSPPIGVYVHIPFCRRRCRYCSFAIVPVGPTAWTTDADADDYDDEDESESSSPYSQMAHNYTEAVLKEIDQIQFGGTGTTDNPPPAIRSIYFGGGTPSLAPLGMLRRILSAVRTKFDPGAGAGASTMEMEISLEMDPGTFDLNKLRAIREMGFNRISLGAQSFDDEILAGLGRTHRTADVFDAVSMLKEVYGADELQYSIDLISGLPGLSLAGWTETLHTAINVLDPPPKHLSLYDLQIEQGTVFSTWYSGDDDEDDDKNNKGPKRSTGRSSYRATAAPAGGEVPSVRQRLPSDEEASYMYKYASGYLKAKGYEHYEVSSYALLTETTPEAAAPDNAAKHTATAQPPSPYRSKHNQVYWALDGQWYAFGLGATSFVDGQLIARPRTLFDYQKWAAGEEKRCVPASEDRSADADAVPDDSPAGKAVVVQQQSELDVLMDVVLKRLRTVDGLSLEWVRTRFPERGQAYVDAILRGAQLGMDLGLVLLLPPPHSCTLRLTVPEGFLVSNSILSSIFLELEQVV